MLSSTAGTVLGQKVCFPLPTAPSQSYEPTFLLLERALKGILSIQQRSVVMCESAFTTTSKVNRICRSFESVGDNSVPCPRKNEYRESAGGNNKLPEEFT